MADDSRGFRLFGFEIKRQDLEDAKKKPSIVPARDDDGADILRLPEHTMVSTLTSTATIRKTTIS